MKRFSILLSLLVLVAAVRGAEPKMSQEEKMAWWNDAKFGMFVHWGPYCLYGGEYHGYKQNRGGAEWIMNRCKIPVMEYRAMTSTFNPVNFDAEKLVTMAKNAGMKYLVFTTKHHDGFAMFNSDHTNYNIVDYTPFNRDILDEIVNACRKYDMKFGFYYSQSQDWNHPGGSTGRKEMKEGWSNPDSAAIDKFTKEHKGAWDLYQTTQTFDEYFHKISLPQIKELVTRYPDVAVMWFDTPGGISDSNATEIMDFLAEYPHIITNDRLKRPNFPGDYKTPEGRVPKAEDTEGIYWETCMNIGSSWGFKTWEQNWKPSSEILRNLMTICARGGNYLLNVGPDPLGEIPATPTQCLKEVGEWMAKYGDAIYDSQRSGLTPEWGECIRKDNAKNSSYYLCVFNWPADGKLRLDGKFSAKKATLLTDNSNLKFKRDKNGITIDVPKDSPETVATLIRLDLNGKLPPVKLISNSEKVFKILDADK